MFGIKKYFFPKMHLNCIIMKYHICLKIHLLKDIIISGKKLVYDFVNYLNNNIIFFTNTSLSNKII